MVAWIGAVVATLAMTVGIAPTARAAVAVAPTVQVTSGSSAGDEMTVFRGTGTGFTAGGTVDVSITVDSGSGPVPYAGSYTHVHTADGNGTFAWSWIWTTGDPPDPYGSYTLTFTDRTTGLQAGAGLTIAHSTTAPTPAAGTHLMLDTASAPPLATMQAWQSGSAAAPYRAIAVYVPVDPAVDDRHDKSQANLTPSWVQAVQAGGWHVVPVYLGLQVPTACQYGSFHAMSSDPAAAQAQGVAAADAAVGASDALGIDPAVPVVYDLESYRTGCKDAAQAFLVGWTARLHEHGRLAGVYGGVSAAGDLASADATDPTYVLPDLFWAATDNHSASTSVTGLPARGWKVANQFLWGVDRTYGGATVNLDESAVDDAAWTLPRPTPPDRTAPIVTTGAGTPALIRTAKARFTWSGVDSGSGLARYQVRIRRTPNGRAPGAWGAPTPAPATTVGSTTLKVGLGEQVCVQIRGVDAAGNGSDWTLPTCTTRLADDRAAKAGGGWHRVRARHAYRGTLTTSTRRHAVLRLGHTAGGTLIVAHAGRGPLVVRIGGKRLATLRGSGTTSVPLPHAGKVTLTTTSAHAVSVDGFALTLASPTLAGPRS